MSPQLPRKTENEALNRLNISPVFVQPGEATQLPRFEMPESQMAPSTAYQIVLSAGVQVVWEKFCNYWDVEPRYVPVTPEHLVLDGFELVSKGDTIPVFA